MKFYSYNIILYMRCINSCQLVLNTHRLLNKMYNELITYSRDVYSIIIAILLQQIPITGFKGCNRCSLRE